jgi:hypothetical protein
MDNTPAAESLSKSGRGDESEVLMLTLQIQDRSLEKQLTELLQQKFNGNSEKMLQELVKSYTAQLNRLKYSGILKWEKDGLTFQKEIRSEWQ